MKTVQVCSLSGLSVMHNTNQRMQGNKATMPKEILEINIEIDSYMHIFNTKE